MFAHSIKLGSLIFSFNIFGECHEPFKKKKTYTLKFWEGRENIGLSSILVGILKGGESASPLPYGWLQPRGGEIHFILIVYISLYKPRVSGTSLKLKYGGQLMDLLIS